MELLRRYFNRPDLLNLLVSVLDEIKNDTPDTEPDLAPVRNNEPGMWRVPDRLSPSDVDTLIESYQAGSAARLLAERYSVSTTTVKRLLREHPPCASSAHESLGGYRTHSQMLTRGLASTGECTTHSRASVRTVVTGSSSTEGSGRFLAGAIRVQIR